MFLTGPGVVGEVMGEDVDAAGLGGPRVHSANGVSQFVADDDRAAVALVRDLLSYFPQRAGDEPPIAPPASVRRSRPSSVVPTSARKVYDVRGVIEALVDDGAMLEVSERWARNMVTALARIDGRPVGVIANQPWFLGGVIDATAAQKAARFVRTCNAFGLPLVVLIDTPGFLPGTKQEGLGVIRHGAKLLHRVRRGRGAEGDGGAAQGLRRRLHHHELEGPGRRPVARLARRRDRDHGAQAGGRRGAPPGACRGRRPRGRARPLAAEYADEHVSAAVAASQGFVDELVEPRDAPPAGERAGGPVAGQFGNGPGNIPYDLRGPRRQLHRRVDVRRAALGRRGGARARAEDALREPGVGRGDQHRRREAPAGARAVADPDVVTLVCGANDVLESVRPDAGAYAERLGRMFARLRSEAPRAAVVTTTYPDISRFLDLRPRTRTRVEEGMRRFNDACRGVAERHGVALLDGFGPAASDRDTYADDGFHPSAEAPARGGRLPAGAAHPVSADRGAGA